MSNDIHISSWKELQQELFRETWDTEIARYRSPYVYRGLSTSYYNLETSLQRLGGDYKKLERHLIRNFRKYAHKNEGVGNSEWNWLAMAQHHGLPTRLLDWTYSPYVALHFATAEIEKFNRDGIIWAVNYVKNNENLPGILKTIIEGEGCNTFTVSMLEAVCPSLKEFDFLQKENFLVFFEPPSLDDRIVNQHALFSLLSNAESNLETYLKQHDDLYFRIIVPKELKWEIRDKLDQANITERVLFPGLDGLSSWLRRHYSPKM